MRRMIMVLFVLLWSIAAGQAQEYSIVINEILFNPARDGYDYVELYNNGAEDVDLDSILIGNRNSTGDLASLKSLARGPTLFRAKQFCVVTADLKWVGIHYSVDPEALVTEPSTMPSLPDDEGYVLIVSRNDSAVIDELHYFKDWHFQVIADPEGVSLERISYFSVTQDRDNWASAASTSGYGTPGARNSQYRDENLLTGGVTVSPEIFSPDNDGMDDYAMIRYKNVEQGVVANGVIYDVSGQKIRYLIRNEPLGSSGQFRWDGQDDRGGSAANGMYVLVLETYTPAGHTRRYKQVIALGRRR